jgi:hypothetical protein
MPPDSDTKRSPPLQQRIELRQLIVDRLKASTPAVEAASPSQRLNLEMVMIAIKT